MGGGVAFIGTVCNSLGGYGLSAELQGTFQKAEFHLGKVCRVGSGGETLLHTPMPYLQRLRLFRTVLASEEMGPARMMPNEEQQCSLHL